MDVARPGARVTHAGIMGAGAGVTGAGITDVPSAVATDRRGRACPSRPTGACT
jgi:hypothetical protein